MKYGVGPFAGPFVIPVRFQMDWMKNFINLLFFGFGNGLKQTDCKVMVLIDFYYHYHLLSNEIIKINRIIIYLKYAVSPFPSPFMF